jgi:hypothetical protein
MDEQTTVAATAITALALSQASFIALVGNGLFSKADAEGFLRQSIETNQQNGGQANRLAASILSEILKNVSAMPVPTRQ